MIGLIKIGFSTKDPELRAKELDHTGSPHPYVVEYDVLVHDPQSLERLVHKDLRSHWEAKEWFRCSVSDAIFSIRSVAGPEALIERVRNPVVAKIPSLYPFATAPRTNPHRNRNLKATATFSGHCVHCGQPFSVALQREDLNAVCPTCLTANDVAEFRSREFGI